MTTINRIILNIGHGMSNAKVGVFDDGAVSQFGKEHDVVTHVGEAFCADAQDDFSVLETPECNGFCAPNHPHSGHLSYVIRWINSHAQAGDLVLSLHMNCAGPQKAGMIQGTETYYAATAPAQRIAQAALISREASSALGTSNRGCFADSDSARGHLGILRETQPAALLIELGYIDNKSDVDAVLANGGTAILHAVKALRDAPATAQP